MEIVSLGCRPNIRSIAHAHGMTSHGRDPGKKGEDLVSISAESKFYCRNKLPCLSKRISKFTACWLISSELKYSTIYREESGAPNWMAEPENPGSKPIHQLGIKVKTIVIFLPSISCVAIPCESSLKHWQKCHMCVAAAVMVSCHSSLANYWSSPPLYGCIQQY